MGIPFLYDSTRSGTALEDRVAERTRQLQAEIAERERAETAFRQAQKMEALGQLTGGVAHDFNNLLLVITGNLEILKTKVATTDAERQIEAIERAAHRGEGLTHQLLAFSRRQPLRPTVVDLNHRVPKLVDLMRASLRGDIEIQTESDPDLWLIEIDPSELELALLNIAVNARDAMPKGARSRFQYGIKKYPTTNQAMMVFNKIVFCSPSATRARAYQSKSCLGYSSRFLPRRRSERVPA